MPDSLPDPARHPRHDAAPTATQHYLREAIAAIDGAFGEGYARQHPDLLAAMIQASAIEAAVEAGREAHGQAMALASRISEETCATILKLKPRLFG